MQKIHFNRNNSLQRVRLIATILLILTISFIAFADSLIGDIAGSAESGTPDGIVNVYDLAVLANQWLQINSDYNDTSFVDLLEGFDFSRDSIAFLDGKQYVSNAPRKRLVAVAGISDCVIHEAEEVAGIGTRILSPKCVSGNYLYATDTTNNNIYRSSDGCNWEKTSSLTGAYKIFGTKKGAIIIVKVNSGLNVKLYRSATGGTDIDDHHLPSPSLILPSDGVNSISMAIWNFYQAANGTICVSEYGTAGGIKEGRIYRSIDDGVSFVQVYDESDNVRHSHRIIKHEATGRWLNVYGDGASINKIVKSDDDGITWITFDPQSNNHFQAVDLYDFGHPTQLLYGSDDLSFLGTLDTLSCKITPLYFDGDRICPYVFALYYHNGIFYAGTSVGTGTPEENRRVAILASPDLIHWAIYHQFRNGEKAVNKFLGFFGGKLHGIVTLSDNSTSRHVSFTPPKIKIFNEICIDPPTTNLLNTAQYSSIETDTSHWYSYARATLERFTSDALHGNSCLRVYGNSGSEEIYTVPTPVTVGKTYSIRVWLKSHRQNLTGTVRWYISGSSRFGQKSCFALSQDQWSEIVLDPATIQSGETHINLNICPRSSDFPGPYDILVDAAQIEQGPPTRWQLGGTPRTNEVLSRQISVMDSWTNIFLWSPECRSEWYNGSGKQYIKTWKKDSNNYMELSFDPSESRFILEILTDGQFRTTKSSPYSFYRNGVIWFAIRQSASETTLSVSASSAFEHLSCQYASNLHSSVLTSTTGNRTGEYAMPCTWLADYVYLGLVDNNSIENLASSFVF